MHTKIQIYSTGQTEAEKLPETTSAACLRTESSTCCGPSLVTCTSSVIVINTYCKKKKKKALEMLRHDNRKVHKQTAVTHANIARSHMRSKRAIPKDRVCPQGITTYW